MWSALVGVYYLMNWKNARWNNENDIYVWALFFNSKILKHSNDHDQHTHTLSSRIMKGTSTRNFKHDINKINDGQVSESVYIRRVLDR